MPVSRTRSHPQEPITGPGSATPRRSRTGAKAGRSGATRGAGKARRPRRKDPLWARLVVIFGAVLMLFSGGTIVGSEMLISHVTSGIEQQNLLGGAAKTEAEGGGSLEGPIDLLLLGVDARKRWAASDVRSDTIIILHIPATHDQAYLLSLPRDTEVQVPPFPKSGYRGGTAKAAEAFLHGAQNGGGWAGGAQLLAETIKKLTGISFDGAAIVNFGGFKKIIDALGGVHMCVDHEVKSIHMKMVDGKPMWNADAKKIGAYNAPPVVHKKGCRDMASWEALDYSRQRKGLPNGDYGRQQNQQKLIKAMAKKAMDKGVLTNPFKVNDLIKAAGEALMIDTGGIPLEEFIFGLRGIAANDLVILRTNGGTFNGFKNAAGKDMERLDETSLAMFRAVRDDKLAEFIINNPSVLAPSKG
ncbi:MAG TPA: LCP family protein [Micromonosporaceae bacterium]